ncbi:MarR family winged helix-turn-helix transcriptional regulator [Nocardia sp. 2YAB30]|uniref:MarR family winged helix-turn-helix transcriptional regulator n=1 Tax=unclassified Nocardia TaxID=2637762 RepID=UPI003F993211
MRRAEELRYLVLAIQREGNRRLSADLRPLGLTPAQAEVLRVLTDYQPLTLAGLGELLVCETGGSPSRLVDRLVTIGLIKREAALDDRRRITLTLTAKGERLSSKVAEIEERLYRTIDEVTDGQPIDAALELMRGFASYFPAVQSVGRRAIPRSAEPNG